MSIRPNARKVAQKYAAALGEDEQDLLDAMRQSPDHTVELDPQDKFVAVRLWKKGLAKYLLGDDFLELTDKGRRLTQYRLACGDGPCKCGGSCDCGGSPLSTQPDYGQSDAALPRGASSNRASRRLEAGSTPMGEVIDEYMQGPVAEFARTFQLRVAGSTHSGSMLTVWFNMTDGVDFDAKKLTRYLTSSGVWRMSVTKQFIFLYFMS